MWEISSIGDEHARRRLALQGLFDQWTGQNV
jgi:hypothetical protein